MPARSRQAGRRPPIVYHDRNGGVWHASEAAQLRVVSPAMDGPNLCLVIRFEREGEERFAHWLGGESWRSQRALDRLFGEAEGGLPASDTGVGPAPAKTVALWVKAVATMGPDELESFEQRRFAHLEPRVVRRPAAGDRAAAEGTRWMTRKCSAG